MAMEADGTDSCGWVYTPRNIRRARDRPQYFERWLAGMDTVHAHMYSLVHAAHTQATWSRRRRLLSEVRQVASRWSLGRQAAVRQWTVLSLMSGRVPTTVISYLRTVVSVYLGGRRHEDTLTRNMRIGLEALYGTQPWYPRRPDLQPEQLEQLLSEIGMSTAARVRLDFEYAATARDADLDYLEWDDITEVGADPQRGLQRHLEVRFRFLKNVVSGTHGVIKPVELRRWEAWDMYVGMRRRRTGASRKVFPMTYREFLGELKQATGGAVTTRCIRRGAARAMAATESATPEQVRDALAHRNVGTQRTYTNTITMAERRQQLVVQRQVRQSGDVARRTVEGPQTTEPRGVSTRQVRTRPRGVRSGEANRSPSMRCFQRRPPSSGTITGDSDGGDEEEPMAKRTCRRRSNNGCHTVEIDQDMLRRALAAAAVPRTSSRASSTSSQ